jgi:hypothetical protein
MYPYNPRDERRHYPIILQGLKHIGVKETPENVVDEDGGDEAWELIGLRILPGISLSE